MAAEFGGRAYRFAVRLVTDGVDHRTIRIAWERYQYEMERRRRERMEPRPLPYVDREDHGEATSLTIPRAPHELGTGAAVAHLHRWMLLSPLATVRDTEFGGRADFDILYQAPPLLSIVHLHASVADATAAYDVVSIDGDGGVLLIGVWYSDPARLPALAYLLCDLATRRATPVPTSLARRPRRPGSVGVIRCQNRVVVAEVESALRVIVFPDQAEPFVVEIAEPFPAGVPHPWGGRGALTHAGFIFYADETTGMLRFDPDAATLDLIPFPAAPAGQARFVGVTQEGIMLAEVHQGGRLRTWTLSEQWEVGHDLVMPLVPRRVTFLHPLDAQTVYLLVSSGAGEPVIVRAHLESVTFTVEGNIPAVSASRLIAMERH